MTATEGAAVRNGTAPTHRVPGPRLSGPWAEVADRLPRSRRQRRPALMVVGVLLVALCGLVSASLVARSGNTVAVLALTRPVSAGHVLVPSDLRVARVGGSGISGMPAAALGSVVGGTATSSLPAGTLLVSGMVSRAPVPAGGSQVVAVAAKAGSVPAGVAPGRDVSLVLISSQVGRQSDAPAVLVPSARVVDMRSDSSTGLALLSVVVSDTLAAQVAQASAAGQLAVTLLPVGS